MTAAGLADALLAVLPAWDTGGATGARLLEQAARQVHLAAARRDWPALDPALAAVDAALAAADPDTLRLVCLHFLAHLHLSGIDPGARAEALRRMPIALYREWRDIRGLLDAIHDGS